mgnify:CR=1 FL=1
MANQEAAKLIIKPMHTYLIFYQSDMTIVGKSKVLLPKSKYTQL